MQSRRAASVAVVGAGVAGLAAARHLARAGLEVSVWEAQDRIGGQVHTVEPVPGLHLDTGAEALHLAAPGVASLLAELGLADHAVTARPISSRVLTTRGLRPLPAGVGPTGPSRLGPVLRSRTLSWGGLARAGLEPVVSRTTRPLAGDRDVSVGEFVTRRFGRQVTVTLVDPLLGGLHAGDVDRLSLRACAPALVPAATGGGSLVLRTRRPASAMGFATWPGGLAELTARLADGLDVRTASPVTGLHRRGDSYDVVSGATTTTVDAVVLAVPAPHAARLLAGLAPDSAATLGTFEAADVATVLLAVPTGAAIGSLRGTGLLVPSGRGRLLKAATYLSHKWPHLDDGEHFWLRLSAGRAGDRRVAALSDDALVAGLTHDLHEITGLAAPPTTAVVRRWPAALPQLTVGHLDRMARVRGGLPAGVVLAGAAYDGLGLTACLRSGAAAAARIAGPDPQEDA